MNIIRTYYTAVIVNLYISAYTKEQAIKDSFYQTRKLLQSATLEDINDSVLVEILEELEGGEDEDTKLDLHHVGKTEDIVELIRELDKITSEYKMNYISLSELKSMSAWDLLITIAGKASIVDKQV